MKIHKYRLKSAIGNAPKLCFALAPLLAIATPDIASAEMPDTAVAAHGGARMHRFVDALLARMTLDEKIGQMNQISSNFEFTGPTAEEKQAGYREEIAAGKVGAVLNAYTTAYTRELQQIAVEKTRLHIPLLFGYDVIHGYRTIFPIPLGEAASWDVDAVELSARIAAREASAEGINWTFAPMVDIARDPRWGRISEGSGEDVYLGSLMAKARVRGFQGNDLSAPDTILATAKHYAAYGAAQAGRDYHTTDMSERELRDTYLPPFKAAVDAGVASFMTAFNDLNGIPATGNRFLLNDVLRDEWGFGGFVVTDWGSIGEMIPHGYAADSTQAGEQAIAAGVDMDMEARSFITHLKASHLAGKVSLAQIDAAVRRILEAKFCLGLFDDPYRYINSKREKAMRDRPDHLAAARDVARKSIVLIKNENAVLPLAASVRSIALIGPLADSKADMIGSWSAAGDSKTRPVTLREGLVARLGGKVQIRTARGASYAFKDAGDHSGFAEALRIAQSSDIVIAAMGESRDMSGEAASRASLDLPGSQQALLEALKQTGKPIVLVLMNGRPLSVTWAADNVDAIVEAWFPGTMGGHAIADVLTGDYNPSGKLPVTFPRSVGQVPLYYDMKNTGRPMWSDKDDRKYGSRYLDEANAPLYPFGYGLSYSNFTLSPITLDRTSLHIGETLRASVMLANTSDRAGVETVQLYIRDMVGSVTRPLKELKGFKQVRLKGGERMTVAFDISEKDLLFHRADMSFGAEPGLFKLFIGKSSADVVESEFVLE
jgi:beta-glucosidase